MTQTFATASADPPCDLWRRDSAQSLKLAPSVLTVSQNFECCYQASSENCLLSYAKHLSKEPVSVRCANTGGFRTSLVERPFLFISVHRTLKTVALQSLLWFEHHCHFLVKVATLGSTYSVWSLERCDRVCNDSKGNIVN